MAARRPEQQVLTYFTDSEMNTRKKSRENILNSSDTFWRSATPCREPFSYLLFLIFPALVCGCCASELQNTFAAVPDSSGESHDRFQVRTTAGIESRFRSLDVFTFENDRMERLDSYQRFEEGQHTGQTCSIASRSGEKIITMIANSSEDKYGWADINCRKALTKRVFNLEDESPHFPIMTGEHCIKAGTTFIADMRPLTGRVVLRSIRCSFSEPQLKEEHLTDVKAYLTNVNASCGIWPEETGPSRIINAGRLNENDLSRFQHPEIIFNQINENIGHERVYPEIILEAYPNFYPEESIGTPYTKLVIEGKIKGHTYYYPIPINRGKGSTEPGIRRDKSYIYDLTITRTGLNDPDGVIKEEEIKANMEIKEWKEKDWYDIRF